MNTTIWRYCAVGFGMFMMGVAVSVSAQQQADPSPVVLPGHHYDLPATLIKQPVECRE